MAGFKLYPYQEEGVAFLTDPNFRHRYLADDPGLGKTVQSIEAANRLGAKSMLIVCPASVKRGWYRSILQHSNSFNAHNTHVCEGSAGYPTEKVSCAILNYDLLIKPAFRDALNQWVSKKSGIDILVMDEAHYLKNPDSKRSACLLSQTGLIHKAKRSILLSGTPMLNKPIELYLPLRVLAPSLLGEYTELEAFGKRYCRGYLADGQWDFRGASHSEELGERVKPFFLRRLMQEVHSQLPDEIYNVVPIKVRTRCMQSLPLSTKMHMIGEAKISQTVKYVEDLLNTEDKIVIFGHHRTVLRDLIRKLSKFNPVFVWGGMDSQTKQDSIDRFILQDSVRIFIAQTQAAGVGIDGLQKVCNHAVFIELEWSPGIMDQAVGRLHRLGQKNTVLVDYLVLEGSADEEVLELLGRKRGVIQKTIDDPREIKSYENEETEMSLEQAILELKAAFEANTETVKKLLGQPVVEPQEETKEEPHRMAYHRPVAIEKPKQKAPKKEKVVIPDAPENEDAVPDYTASIRKFISGYVGEKGISPEVEAARKNQIREVSKSFDVAASKDLSEDQKPEYLQKLLALEPITSVVDEEV